MHSNPKKHNVKKVIPFISQLNVAEQKKWISALRQACPDLKIVPFNQLPKNAYETIEVAIIANPDPQQLFSLKNLKWVQSLWAGIETLLSDIPQPHFQIVSMKDPQLSVTMSHSVLAWTLFLQHQIPIYQFQQHKKIWQQHESKIYSETTVGILGLGNLGEASAKILIDQGFSVSGWSRSQKKIEAVRCYNGESGLESILKSSDILISLLPLTKQTHHLLNRTRLSLLPTNAAVINFSRGSIIDLQELVNALDNSQLSHAVLDVFDVEPLPLDSPLWEHPKITVLPHISAPTNKQTAAKIVVRNILNYIENGTIPRSINTKIGY